MRFQCVQGPALGFLRDCLFDLFCIFTFFCCRLYQEVSGWSRWLEICVTQALFGKYFFRGWLPLKSDVFGH